MPAILALEQRGIEVLVPDSWAARELSGRIEPVTMNARQQHRHPGLQQLRERMCGIRRYAPVTRVAKHWWNQFSES